MILQAPSEGRGAARSSSCSVSSNSTSSPSSNGEPLREFHLFRELPKELRLDIWKFACFAEPTTVSMSIDDSTFTIGCDLRVPAVVHVSGEARMIALEYYKELEYATIVRGAAPNAPPPTAAPPPILLGGFNVPNLFAPPALLPRRYGSFYANMKGDFFSLKVSNPRSTIIFPTCRTVLNAVRLGTQAAGTVTPAFHLPTPIATHRLIPEIFNEVQNLAIDLTLEPLPSTSLFPDWARRAVREFVDRYLKDTLSHFPKMNALCFAVPSTLCEDDEYRTEPMVLIDRKQVAIRPANCLISALGPSELGFLESELRLKLWDVLQGSQPEIKVFIRIPQSCRKQVSWAYS